LAKVSHLRAHGVGTRTGQAAESKAHTTHSHTHAHIHSHTGKSIHIHSVVSKAIHASVSTGAIDSNTIASVDRSIGDEGGGRGVRGGNLTLGHGTSGETVCGAIETVHTEIGRESEGTTSRVHAGHVISVVQSGGGGGIVES